MQKTEKKYWNKIWNINSDYRFLDENSAINQSIISKISTFFSNKPVKVFEIGCANSQWLPYFSKKFNSEISGMDYSENGIEKTKKIYIQNNIPCDFYLRDFRKNNPELHKRFDIIFSFGLIEHFTDTENVISAFSKYLKKNGIIISIIPNLSKFSIYYNIQKILGYRILCKHKLINLDDFKNSHSENFKILFADYIGKLNFHLLSFSQISGRPYIILRYFLALLNKIFGRFVSFESQLLSPYIMIIGIKK